jgi:hypothetical protein
MLDVKLRRLREIKEPKLPEMVNEDKLLVRRVFACSKPRADWIAQLF